MLNKSRPVRYRPLSNRETFEVSSAGSVCHVKLSQGDGLEVGVSEANGQLRLSIGPEASKSPLGLLVAVEYLLGHNDHLHDVALDFKGELDFPLSLLGRNFSRGSFFQLPQLWHKSQTYQVAPELWTETKGVHHPVRPVPDAGVTYRRYSPQIGKEIIFRLADLERDLETFHEWHNQPRVSFFWELNQSKDELRDYLAKGLKDPHQHPYIVEVDGEPAGYYELYWVKEDRLGPYYDSEAFDRGFHFLIGNKKYLGPGTDAIIKSGLHFMYLDDPRTRKIMAEPRHDNQKVLKYAEASVGWTKLKEFDFPHKRAALLENRREKFFGGNAL